MFQICERRKHQLIESHVTCYSVQKTVNAESGVPFQIRRMKLDVPSNSFSFLMYSIRTTLMEAICSSFSLLLWYASSIQMLLRSTTSMRILLSIPCSRIGRMYNEPVSSSPLQLHVDRRFVQHDVRSLRVDQREERGRDRLQSLSQAHFARLRAALPRRHLHPVHYFLCLNTNTR